MMHIVLINGWSAPASLWAGFFDLFPGSIRFDIIDINRAKSLDAWMDEIDTKVDDGTVLMGWSLGGELALSYAVQTAKNLKALCLLQTNPCFVQKENWHFGMPLDEFQGFSELVKSGDLVMLKKHFAHLMAAGSSHYKDDRRRLRKLYEPDISVEPEVLVQSLGLLAELDLRASLNDLKCPVLNIFGDQDALVPIEVSQQVGSIVIEGMGHLPCLSYAPSVYAEFEAFMESHG